jgi:hypothetical protein
MPARRRSSRFLTAIAGLSALVALVAAHGLWWGNPSPETRAADLALVRGLGLSDLVLATEARYTRHPALADRHSAFQDHPGALDHFPSAAVIPPPPHLRTP